jgi:hypothetical protein
VGWALIKDPAQRKNFPRKKGLRWVEGEVVKGRKVSNRKRGCPGSSSVLAVKGRRKGLFKVKGSLNIY